MNKVILFAVLVILLSYPVSAELFVINTTGDTNQFGTATVPNLGQQLSLGNTVDVTIHHIGFQLRSAVAAGNASLYVSIKNEATGYPALFLGNTSYVPLTGTNGTKIGYGNISVPAYANLTIYLNTTGVSGTPLSVLSTNTNPYAGGTAIYTNSVFNWASIGAGYDIPLFIQYTNVTNNLTITAATYSGLQLLNFTAIITNGTHTNSISTTTGSLTSPNITSASYNITLSGFNSNVYLGRTITNVPGNSTYVFNYTLLRIQLIDSVDFSHLQAETGLQYTSFRLNKFAGGTILTSGYASTNGLYYYLEGVHGGVQLLSPSTISYGSDYISYSLSSAILLDGIPGMRVLNLSITPRKFVLNGTLGLTNFSAIVNGTTYTTTNGTMKINNPTNSQTMRVFTTGQVGILNYTTTIINSSLIYVQAATIKAQNQLMNTATPVNLSADSGTFSITDGFQSLSFPSGATVYSNNASVTSPLSYIITNNFSLGFNQSLTAANKDSSNYVSFQYINISSSAYNGYQVTGYTFTGSPYIYTAPQTSILYPYSVSNISYRVQKSAQNIYLDETYANMPAYSSHSFNYSLLNITLVNTKTSQNVSNFTIKVYNTAYDLAATNDTRSGNSVILLTNGTYILKITSQGYVPTTYNVNTVNGLNNVAIPINQYTQQTLNAQTYSGLRVPVYNVTIPARNAVINRMQSDIIIDLNISSRNILINVNFTTDAQSEHIILQSNIGTNYTLKYSDFVQNNQAKFYILIDTLYPSGNYVYNNIIGYNYTSSSYSTICSTTSGCGKYIDLITNESTYPSISAASLSLNASSTTQNISLRYSSPNNNLRVLYQNVATNASYNMTYSALNVSVTTIAGALINNVTTTIVNNNTGEIHTNVTRNGLSVFYVSNGNYTIHVDPDGYQFANTSRVLTDGLTNVKFTVYTTNSMNITIYDSISKVKVPGTTTIEFISDAMSQTNTTATGNIYVDLLSPSDYSIRFRNPNYVETFYYLRLVNRSTNTVNVYMNNASLIPTNITQPFVDQSTNPLISALIKVQKYDIATNTYIQQNSLITDEYGKVYFSGFLFYDYYRFVVEYPVGRTVYTSEPAYLTTSIPSYIIVPVGTPEETGYDLASGITATTSFNNNTEVASFTWNDPDAVASEYCLNVFQKNGVNIYTSCTNSQSGQILTVINTTTYSYITIQGVATIDGTDYVLSTSIYERLNTAWGLSGLLFTFLATIILVFIFRSDPIAALIALPIPITLTTLMGISGLTGWIPVVVWIICLAIAYILRY